MKDTLINPSHTCVEWRIHVNNVGQIGKSNAKGKGALKPPTPMHVCCVGHNSACHQQQTQKQERTDGAATQRDLLGLGDGRHLPLGPLVDALVDGVDESQEGALLLELVLTLAVMGRQ